MSKSLCRQPALFAEVSILPQLCCALILCFDFDCAVAPRYLLHSAEVIPARYENHSFSTNTKQVIFKNIPKK